MIELHCHARNVIRIIVCGFVIVASLSNIFGMMVQRDCPSPRNR